MATRFGVAQPPHGTHVPVSPREDPSEDDYGSPRSEMATDLQSFLRILAETQKMMLTQSQTGGKSRILANVKIPEFDGAEGTTVRQYKQWR